MAAERCGLLSVVVAHELAGKTARPDRMPSTVFSIHLWPSRTSLIIVQTRALTRNTTDVSHSDEVRRDGTDDAGIASSAGGARADLLRAHRRHPPSGRTYTAELYLSGKEAPRVSPGQAVRS
jgi:hypothetical protein